MNIGLMLLYGNNNDNIFFWMTDDIGENRPKVIQNITQQNKKNNENNGNVCGFFLNTLY